ncbi:MAG: hypothetical protein IKH81_00830 [Clostridia bacterium]|nr:hypothetical protein [Clostridia bacterium]
MKKTISILLLTALIFTCLPVFGGAETAAAPTDFTFNTTTGEFSFQAVDKNIGYYFVRIYSTSSGVEAGEYTVSSKRLNGGKTGEIKGTVKLDSIGWGPYAVKLVANAAAGTGIESPVPVILNAFYGVGGVLERPEAMAFYGKNRVQIILDWWTLCDYLGLNYMPLVKITFWADEECTQEIYAETVDTYDLLATLTMNPPSVEYIWGYSQIDGSGWMYTTNRRDDEEEEEDAGSGSGGSSGGTTMAFTNDIYTFTTSDALPAGTYFVTVQALSKDEQIQDSKVSSPMEIVLTDEEAAPDYSDEYSVAQTELWKDPQQLDMPGANPFEVPERVDLYSNQETTATID